MDDEEKRTLLHDLIGKETNLSYPLVEQSDLILKLGKNMVVIVDTFGRHFDYRTEGHILSVYEFYNSEYINELESMQWSKPIRCKIKNGTTNGCHYRFRDENGNDVLRIVKSGGGWKFDCEEYNCRTNSTDERFLSNLL